MNAANYQKQAARTLIDAPGFEISDEDIMIVWNAIGLAGEAGEVAETVKKGIFHQHGLDRDKMKKELGDVCWYLAAMCTTLGLDLGDVMQANIDKLQKRYPDGFNSADSVKRVDVPATSSERTQTDAAAVDWFAGRMKAKLAQNEHKGGWEDETIERMLRLLRSEVQELTTAVDCTACRHGSLDEVVSEAADVANFAMMIADICRIYQGERR